MDEQLRKRLEKAAKRLVDRGWGDIESAITKGAELGYREAIIQAKKWLLDHFSTDVECNENGEPLAESYIEGRKLAIKMLTDFEIYMNKLWEEKK